MSDHIADLFALQHWRARAAELERERDEARAEIARLRAALDEANTARNAALDLKTEVRQRYIDAQERCEQAQRERDEARQRADTFRELAQDARCCMVELLELVERYLPSGNEGPLIRRWLVRLGAELREEVAS